MQKEYEKYDAVGMIILILSSINNQNLTDELYRHFLLLCIELLQGGNMVMQNAFYNYFTTFPKSENIFKKLYNIINDFTNELKLSRVKKD